MHHVVVERWSRGSSGLHRRDPRAKIAALLILLISLATAGRSLPPLAAMLFAALFGAILWARIPVVAVLSRACLVLSFTVPFALLSILAGDASRALAILLKSYLSALAVLLLTATTPLAMLLRGLENIGAPRFLLMVAQFLYRYLFVIAEEAQQMRIAARSRGGAGRRGQAARFRAAAGAVGALFARSYTRAEAIHRAMLARGFNGHFPASSAMSFSIGDVAFTLAAAAAIVLARFAAERLAV